MESDDEINYKALRKIQQLEKTSPVLTKITPNFYRDLSDFLKNLEKRLDEESSSQTQMLLKDEIHNTKKIATNIYEQREKKILLAAISKARGGNPDLNSLESTEKKLFDSILHLMNMTREELMNNKKKDIEEKTVESKVENQNQENTNPIVMVTQDIPEFLGTDSKKYALRKGDVISLPEDMNNTLSKRDVVKEIKQ